MGEVYFYHLTRAPLEATLPTLLARARGAGWRVAVRGTEQARLDWLDQNCDGLTQADDEGYYDGQALLLEV